MFISNFRLKSAVQKATVFARRTSDYSAMHPYREMERQALLDTASFIQAEMPDALAFDTPRGLLSHALKIAPKAGLVAEFGVNAGGTARFIARALPDRTLHGFDSFEGLPQDWSGNNMAAGYFSRRGRLPRLPGNVVLHPGWFDDTVPPFAAAHPEPVAFLHIDCDLYSSTRTILEHLGPRIGTGSVLVFDEYFNYPNWRAHEHRALREFVEATGRSFRYFGYAFRQAGVVFA